MSNEIFNWTMSHLLDIAVIFGIIYGSYKLYIWWKDRGAKSINNSATLTKHSHTTDTTKLKQEV